MSHLLQGDNGRHLLSGRFTSVIGRGDWKVFIVREILIYYKERGEQNVFLVNEFHFCYKESGMEGVCH